MFIAMFLSQIVEFGQIYLMKIKIFYHVLLHFFNLIDHVFWLFAVGLF